jgi:hypothetical protein
MSAGVSQFWYRHYRHRTLRPDELTVTQLIAPKVGLWY